MGSRGASWDYFDQPIGPRHDSQSAFAATPSEHAADLSGDLQPRDGVQRGSRRAPSRLSSRPQRAPEPQLGSGPGDAPEPSALDHLTPLLNDRYGQPPSGKQSRSRRAPPAAPSASFQAERHQSRRSRRAPTPAPGFNLDTAQGDFGRSAPAQISRPQTCPPRNQQLPVRPRGQLPPQQQQQYSQHRQQYPQRRGTQRVLMDYDAADPNSMVPHRGWNNVQSHQDFVESEARKKWIWSDEDQRWYFGEGDTVVWGPGYDGIN